MGTIQPGYISTQGFTASMSHKDTSLVIQQATYRSQMMGTIRPGYLSTKGFSASMPLKDTSLAIQQAIYQSQIKEDYLPEYKLQGFRSTLTQ